MGLLTAIRRAHTDDAEVVASIYVESWRAAYAGLLPDRVLVGMSVARQTAQWRAAIRRAGAGRGETILVADNTADGVVGMASCGRARAPALGHEGELFTLYVGLDHLGQGYGRALLDESFRRLAEGGCASALVWVLAGNPSRFFYAAMGGRRVAARVETLWGADVAEDGYGWPDLSVIRGDEAPCSLR